MSSGTKSTLVEGDCLILFIPSLGKLASSLFRPRRNILAVFDGVFYWLSSSVVGLARSMSADRIVGETRFTAMDGGKRACRLVAAEAIWHAERTAAFRAKSMSRDPHGRRCTSDASHSELAADGFLVASRRSAASLVIAEATRHAPKPSWPLPVADAYVRGNDLVATYRPADELALFAATVLARRNACDRSTVCSASISLLVSVQTHLLDTCPQISVVSHIPAMRCITLRLTNIAKCRLYDVAATIASSDRNGTVLAALSHG